MNPKDIESLILGLLKEVDDMLWKPEQSDKCPSDEYGNTWQSRARRLEKKVHALEVEVTAIGGEREYFKSRVVALNAEVERLQEELSTYTEDKKSDAADITEEPDPWSYTQLMDMDGDLWSRRATINGRLWHCDTVSWVEPLSFDDLKATYGPLQIPPFRTK